MLFSIFILALTCVVTNAVFQINRHVQKAPTKAEANEDRSFGPFIVHLNQDIVDHDNFENHVKLLVENQRPFVQYGGEITQRYSHVFHGAVVQGVSKKDLKSLPGVVRVVPDTKKRIQTGISDIYSWGVDRINQVDLPLDGIYASDYNGAGVDVYIVDTGLDTNHIEFQGSGRTVSCIYNAYGRGSKKLNPGTNTDTQGHGTHVAGTIGGKTVGVSPGANLLSLKVLNDQGEGDTSAVVAALDYVLQLSRTSGRRSVVSMSLGGPCETSDCSVDSVVIAAEALAAANVVVSVAAGNEGCNACSGSPNSAPNALTGTTYPWKSDTSISK